MKKRVDAAVLGSFVSVACCVAIPLLGPSALVVVLLAFGAVPVPVPLRIATSRITEQPIHDLRARSVANVTDEKSVSDAVLRA